jgi:hypothetical protein
MGLEKSVFQKFLAFLYVTGCLTDGHAGFALAYFAEIGCIFR